MTVAEYCRLTGFEYTKVRRIIDYILQGLDMAHISRLENCSDQVVFNIYGTFIQTTIFKPPDNRPKTFGHKTTAYYKDESEMMTKPTYNIEDLKGEELEILNTLKDGNNNRTNKRKI